MTYNVFGGTLNLTLSIYLSVHKIFQLWTYTLQDAQLSQKDRAAGWKWKTGTGTGRQYLPTLSIYVQSLWRNWSARNLVKKAQNKGCYTVQGHRFLYLPQKFTNYETDLDNEAEMSTWVDVLDDLIHSWLNCYLRRFLAVAMSARVSPCTHPGLSWPTDLQTTNCVNWVKFNTVQHRQNHW